MRVFLMKVFWGIFAGVALVGFASCAGTQQEAEREVKEEKAGKVETAELDTTAAQTGQKTTKKTENAIPDSYKALEFLPYSYETPDPLAYRVVLSDSVTGYIVSDTTLPLSSLAIFFRESTVPAELGEAAAKEVLSGMFRNGGTKELSPSALDDSLDFISAKIGGSLGSLSSSVEVNSLSRDFYETALLAREIFTKPAFDSSRLELQKAAFVEAYEHRFDSPSDVLKALRYKVNYAPSPRLWDVRAEEYAKVSRADLLKAAPGKFNPGRVIFAYAGDLPRDSVLAFLKQYFAGWQVDTTAKRDSAERLKLLRKPGIFAVEREVTQANISLNQPFLRRPHPDYYPAAVASFILGGGSFSSRLMERVRSDEGLVYGISSRVGNSFDDTTLTTIFLQTKADQAPKALEIIFAEIRKLAEGGPTGEELAQAKKTLIESLPSQFPDAEETAVTFASNEYTGRKFDHYKEYVEEISAVTAEQVKQMIAKYFDPEKMTISIVGPRAAFEALPNVQVIPIDSLEMRP